MRGEQQSPPLGRGPHTAQPPLFHVDYSCHMQAGSGYAMQTAYQRPLLPGPGVSCPDSPGEAALSVPACEEGG